jgi:hypothetical protein
VTPLVICEAYGLATGEGGEEKGAFPWDLNCDVLTRAIGWRTVIGYANQPGKPTS